MGRRTRGNRAVALVAILVVAAAFAQFDLLGVAKPLEGAEVDGCDGSVIRLDGQKMELLRLHNEARSEHGAGSLCVQEDLMAAAQGHAEDMIRRDFYDHETPGGLTPGDRISHTGYPFATYGENNNRVSDRRGGARLL